MDPLLVFGLPKFVVNLQQLNALGILFGGIFMLASLFLWWRKSGLVLGVAVAFISVVFSFWLATKTGMGIAGAIGLLYGVFLGIVGIFLALFSGLLPKGLKGTFVTVGLALASFSLPTFFATIDH
jgi:hypothetical protein